MKGIKERINKILMIALLTFIGLKANSQCAANFTYALLPAGAVSFTSTSTLINTITTNYNWSFGNNQIVNGANITTTSTTYSVNGTYVATLSISSPTPLFCNSTYTALINITNTTTPCNLVANFNVTQGANGFVVFNNTSTGTVGGTTYSWNFGDNGTSNTPFPTHTYSANGTYIATLTANNNFTPTCISTKTFAVIVTSWCNLVANFIYTQGPNGLVNYTSTSVGTNSAITGYTWTSSGISFASGINLTQTANTFTANGTYPVQLIIRQTNNLSCDDTLTQQITVISVTNTPCLLVSNFNYTQGTNGLVNFNNISTGTIAGTTYSWSFGDNTSGNTISPAHTYSANGAYTVTLTTSNNALPVCVSTKTAIVLVNSYCNLIAGFSHTVGAAGQVYFQSTSAGTTALSQYTWNFSNGNGFGQSPTKGFANGTYAVTLTVINLSTVPTCSNSVSNTIVVTSNTCSINASFNHTVGAQGQVIFQSTSTGTTAFTAYTWNFGDGYISYVKNPIHSYASGGVHYVSLSTQDTVGSVCLNTTTLALNITNVPCIANSNFTLTPTGVPKFWNAIPAYPWNVTSALWTWGDGTSTPSLYCSHVYSVAGNYSICLTVTASCGATATTCSSYFINKTISPVADIININVAPPGALLGVEKNFIAKDADWLVYPNPTDGVFILSTPGTKLKSIHIYNLTGSECMTLYFDENNITGEETINISALQRGIYFIKATTLNSVILTKVIKSL